MLTSGSTYARMLMSIRSDPSRLTEGVNNMANTKRGKTVAAKSGGSSGRTKHGGLTKRGRHRIPPREPGPTRALPRHPVLVLGPNMKKKLVF